MSKRSDPSSSDSSLTFGTASIPSGFTVSILGGSPNNSSPKSSGSITVQQKLVTAIIVEL